MNYKNVLAIGSLVAGAALTSPAYSQLYLGGTFGGSNYRPFCGEQQDCDKTGGAARLLAGYNFTPRFGAEVAYFDLGTATIKDPGAGSTTRLHSRGGDAVLRLSYVARHASLFAKGGAYYAGTKQRAETPALVVERSEVNSGLTYGIGAQYDATRNIEIRADWQRYLRVGGPQTGNAMNVDAFMIGATWTFR